MQKVSTSSTSILAAYLSPTEEMPEGPLAGRISVIPDITKSLLERGTADGLKAFLYKELDHLTTLANAQTQAQNVLLALQAPSAVKIPAAGKRLITRESTLADQILKIQELMVRLKTELNHTSYSWLKMTGQTKWSDYFPSFSYRYDYLDQALQDFEKTNPKKDPILKPTKTFAATVSKKDGLTTTTQTTTAVTSPALSITHSPNLAETVSSQAPTSPENSTIFPEEVIMVGAGLNCPSSTAVAHELPTQAANKATEPTVEIMKTKGAETDMTAEENTPISTPESTAVAPRALPVTTPKIPLLPQRRQAVPAPTAVAESPTQPVVLLAATFSPKAADPTVEITKTKGSETVMPAEENIPITTPVGSKKLVEPTAATPKPLPATPPKIALFPQRRQADPPPQTKMSDEKPDGIQELESGKKKHRGDNYPS